MLSSAKNIKEWCVMIEVYGPFDKGDLMSEQDRIVRLYDLMGHSYEKFCFREHTSSMLRELFMLQSILEGCLELKKQCDGCLPMVSGTTQSRDRAVFSFSERLLWFFSRVGLFSDIFPNVFVLSNSLLTQDIYPVVKAVSTHAMREVLHLYHRLAKEPAELDYSVVSMQVAYEFHEASDMLASLGLIHQCYDELPVPYKEDSLFSSMIALFSERVAMLLPHVSEESLSALSPQMVGDRLLSGEVDDLQLALAHVYKYRVAVCRKMRRSSME